MLKAHAHTKYDILGYMSACMMRPLYKSELGMLYKAYNIINVCAGIKIRDASLRVKLHAMGSLLHAMLLILSSLVDLSSCSNTNGKVQWYRTTRDTADRLTQQPNLTMGTDFTSDQVVTFKR